MCLEKQLIQSGYESVGGDNHHHDLTGDARFGLFGYEEEGESRLEGSSDSPYTFMLPFSDSFPRSTAKKIQSENSGC